MGNSEETKPSKPVKRSSPPLDQANNIYVYPDWAAMQMTPSLLVVLLTNLLFITSKYDLYSKSKVRIDVEKVKPYYLSLIEKYFPAKLRW